ncbi:MAG: hypothetical protein Q8N37_04440 [bacterium]|nr:hypothetical protein [bacterium]
MEKPSVRILYLYAFALVGLVLVTFGAVRLLDLGLKMYVFKKADQPQDYRNMPPYPPITINQKTDEVKYSETITPEQKIALNNWITEFKYWNENQKNIDYLASSRQSTASNSFAMILIGLPLYLYHWRIVRKEARENNAIS